MTPLRRRRIRDHCLITLCVTVGAMLPHEYWYVGLGANMIWIWIDVVLEDI